MQRKIGIMYVMPSLVVGGAEKLLLTTVKYLNRDRYEISVCCIVSEGIIADEIKKLGIKFYCLKESPRFYNPKKIYSLYKLFRKEKPAIVHTQILGANIYGRIAAILARVPVIISTEHNVYYKKKKIHIWLDKILAKNTDKIIAVSNKVKEFTSRQEGIAKDKFELIYNGIDSKEFLSAASRKDIRNKLNLREGDFILGTVGTITTQKGHYYLIQAVSQLVKRYPNTVLLVVGKGELKEKLQEIVGKLRLKENVHFLGLRRDIPNLLNCMDVFVFPSLWEGTPLALLEAMLMELPVIASSVDGILEVVESGKNGILVPPGNVEALSDAIDRLIRNPQLRQNLGKAAREHILEKFEVRQYIRKLESLYNRLLEEKLEGKREKLWRKNIRSRK